MLQEKKKKKESFSLPTHRYLTINNILPLEPLVLVSLTTTHIFQTLVFTIIHD